MNSLAQGETASRISGLLEALSLHFQDHFFQENYPKACEKWDSGARPPRQLPLTVMRKTAWLVGIWCSIASPMMLRAANSNHFDYSFYEKTLQSCIDDRGLVDYRNLKLAGVEFQAFIQQLAKFSPENHPEIFPNREAQLAYWINAYNAFALKGAVDNYPTRSVRNIRYMYGFFWRLRFDAGGRRYTLRHIENEIIRKRYQDPRIHFALVWAAMGCPRLDRQPFLPERLNEQLESAAHLYIGETRNVRIDLESGRLWLSKIFAPSWYQGDFLYWYSVHYPESKPGISDYLKLYLPPDLKRLLEANPRLKPEYIDYDWLLNDQALHPVPKL